MARHPCAADECPWPAREQFRGSGGPLPGMNDESRRRRTNQRSANRAPPRATNPPPANRSTIG